MKQGIRLFDFSVFNAVTVILAYLVLVCLCAGVAAGAQNPLPALLVLIVLVISFVALFWYFWSRAPLLTEQTAIKGKVSIEREHVACEIFYHTRYREKTLRLYDKRKPDAKGKADCITVQATGKNVKKLATWLAIEVSDIPDNTKRNDEKR